MFIQVCLVAVLSQPKLEKSSQAQVSRSLTVSV